MILGLVLGDVECFVRAFGGTIGAQTPSFFEFSLCLSRACLGKMIVFIYKWRKNLRIHQTQFKRAHLAKTGSGPS
jgi:hypothetical protein